MSEELTVLLRGTVERYKTYSYDFDLALTRFSEAEPDIDRRALLDCVDALLSEGDTDAAFAGLYLFTIYLKNDGNAVGLENVVTRYEGHFDEEKYPLILELKSRYLKRRVADIGAWQQALACDKRALDLLHGVFFAQSTYGVNASYASTLCRILEYGVRHRDALEKIKEFTGRDDYLYALHCISENIRNNSTYAKNYFLKAELMYYYMTAFGSEPEKAIQAVQDRCDMCDSIIAELSKAIDLEEAPSKRETYRALAETVFEYQSGLASTVSDEWEAQLQSSDSFDSCVSPMCHAKLSGRKYAYVCYSRMDYKAVFSDLYRLYCSNISVEYDRIVKSGSKWSASVKEAILDSDCAVVIFFLSRHALTSDSIYKEISIVRASSKKYFFISVTGDTASRMLYELYNAEAYEPLFKNSLTSDRLAGVISFFNDSIHFISRTESDYTRKLAGDIHHYFSGRSELLHGPVRPGAAAKLTAAVYTEPNGRIINGAHKPNEDYLISDEDQGLFIVADGVTRPHSEYPGQGPSAAYTAAKVFCQSAFKTLKSGLPRCTDGHAVERMLSDAFSEGNAEVAQWNKTWLQTHQENKLYKPAVVALCAVVYKESLYYCYIGDCIGVLIRGNCRHVFAERQTQAASKLHLTKEQLYLNYVNNPGGKHAYGILNGDPLACAMTVNSHFALENGDHIILSTDGLANMLLYERTEILTSGNFTSLIRPLSVEYDLPPFAEYSDDKALISVTVDELPV